MPFSLTAFPIMSLSSSAHQFDYDIAWCGFLWVYPVWGSLTFLNLQIYFTEFGKCSAIISSSTFPDLPCLHSFQNSHKYVRSFAIVPQVPGALIIFFHLFSLLFYLEFHQSCLLSSPFCSIVHRVFLSGLYFSPKLPFGSSCLLFLCCDYISM